MTPVMSLGLHFAAANKDTFKLCLPPPFHSNVTQNCYFPVAEHEEVHQLKHHLFGVPGFVELREIAVMVCMCGFLGLDIKEAYDRLNRAVLLTATPFRRASKDISLDRVVVGLQY